MFATTSLLPAQTRCFIGSFSDKGPGNGIFTTSLDTKTGLLGTPMLAAELAAPTFLVISPNRKIVYSVSGNPAAVNAFAIEDSGTLRLLNSRAVPGGPCQLAISPTGKFLAAANYGGGSFALLPLDAEGRLGEVSGLIQNSGSGPNPSRQTAPHAHSVVFNSPGTQLLSADLGIDRVVAAKINLESGALIPEPEKDIILPPGSGPRYLTFGPDDRYLYLANELSNTVATMFYDVDHGRSSLVEIVPTLPSDFTGKNTVAHIGFHPSGKWLYLTNRGHDSIVQFTRDEKTGKLIQPVHVASGGKNPWHFSITPDGQWMALANMGSDNIQMFRVDSATGALTAHGEPVPVKKPSCIQFVNPQ